MIYEEKIGGKEISNAQAGRKAQFREDGEGRKQDAEHRVQENQRKEIQR